MAIPIRTAAQTALVFCAVFKSVSFLNQSRNVDEASEFMDELNVDMAADKTPASKSPLNPIGSLLII